MANDYNISLLQKSTDTASKKMFVYVRRTQLMRSQFVSVKKNIIPEKIVKS